MENVTEVGIVFDIGGSKTRVASVHKDTLLEVEIVDTPENPEEGLALIEQLVKKIIGNAQVTAVVGDAPGIVENGVLVRAPNLLLWNDTDVSTFLKNALGAPVTLFNDSELVALGEYEYGAGEHSSNMMYLTVSTGVGGALIENGEIQRGKYNVEIGHQLVGDDTVENQISGTAVRKKYGIDPWKLESIEEREKLAEILAKSLYDNVLHWSPDTIVIGGSMITGENPIPIDHVEETLNKLVTTMSPHAPRVKKAQLGKLGGLYGGMAYLKRAT